MKARIAVDRYVKIGETDDRLFGSFIEHIGRAVYEGIYQPGQKTADENGFRGDVTELIRELGVSCIRYPGGNFVSGYKWEDGIGPRENRPGRLDFAWKSIETNQFGLDEFIDFCRKTNTEPMMALNFGTRGLESAMELLEYCNHKSGSAMSDLRIKNGHKEPHNIKMWCLGNEMDGKWQIGHMNAHEYARTAAEVGRVFKAYDPSLEIIACGSSVFYSKTFGEWERTILEEAYDAIDYLSLHMYWSNAKNDTPNFLAQNLEMEKLICAVLNICDYEKTVKRSKKQINLSFDEWNVWYHSLNDKIPEWTEHPHINEDVYNLEDAILVGSALITMLRHADRIKIACLAQLVNVIAPIMTSDNGVWKQTIFYPFLHASMYGRGTVLQTTVLSPTYSCSVSDSVPYLDSVVVENEEKETLTVLMVNKSLTDAVDVECDLRQYENYTVDRHIVLTGPDLKAVNTEAEPYCVVPVMNGESANDKGAFSAHLLPTSWNVVILRKER
ncbi:MAG: alpha-N-arabinofuranosidase [Clostridia bacterium]|nr:alpha-N-arabinofuranosidase [Clostridia bacterium]